MASDEAYARTVRWSDDFLRMRRARSAFRRRLAVGLPGGDVELRAWLERCGQEWIRSVVIERVLAKPTHRLKHWLTTTTTLVRHGITAAQQHAASNTRDIREFFTPVVLDPSAPP